MGINNTNRTRRIILYSLVATGVAGTLALVVLLFGSVSGTEFSPSHFKMRRFTVHEIPLLRIQISPMQRTAMQTATARYLIAQSLIQTPAGPPNDWQLVDLTRAKVNQTEADPKLLTDQLEFIVYNQANSTGNEFWHDWSIREPAKAKVLWPVIQKLAIRELYVLIPKLFSLAIDANSERSLQQSIDDYLRVSYVNLVSEMRDAKRTELADEFLSEALADFPSDEKLQALR